MYTDFSFFFFKFVFLLLSSPLGHLLTRPSSDLGASPRRLLRGKTSSLGQAARFDSGFGIIGVVAF